MKLYLPHSWGRPALRHFLHPDNAQLLLWDSTRTLPEGTNNQQYYIKDFPPANKGEVEIHLQGLKKGNYKLAISQVGYKQNDSFTAYIGMGSPAQLNKAQVVELKVQATGRPSQEKIIRVTKDSQFNVNFPLRENDVYLVELALIK
jgi:xylan 1,4-beta-xylosidase